MKNIGVFAGGYSSEYEISLLSAQTIIQHFPNGYTPYLIIVEQNKWRVQNVTGQLLEIKPWSLSFTLDNNKINLDAGLIYIHGLPGENGWLQSFFEMNSLPYINANPLASALSFNKWYCNQFLKGFGFDVAKSVKLRKGDIYDGDSICKKLGLPCFVKPSDSGSSFGISKVKRKEDLDTAIKAAFVEGDELLIESFLEGTEVTCGLFKDSEGLHALPLTEIVTENEFFDYNAKYKGESKEITPARLSKNLTEKVQEKAKAIYDLLQLASIARIDFMLVNDVPFVIEVNTTPGFSPQSIVPQMLHCAEIPIQTFWTRIFDYNLRKI